MIKRPAAFTEAEIRRAIAAAKKEGAVEVAITIPGQGTVTIRLTEKIKNIEDDEVVL